MARISVLKVLFIILSSLLVACQQSYDGDVVEDREVESDVVINEQGRVEYLAQCSNCHGSDGTGGPGGTVINLSLIHISEPTRPY